MPSATSRASRSLLLSESLTLWSSSSCRRLPRLQSSDTIQMAWA